MRGTNFMTFMIANSDFEEADLRGANLQYCVAFTGKNEGTNWRGTGFTKASLYGSKMTKEQIEESRLTKEQVEQIIQI